MQMELHISSLNDTAPATQYLDASSCYIISGDLRIRDFFPDIAKDCPRCHGTHCAIWKGYYKRRYICPVLDFNGLVIIRKAYCKTYDCHLSFLPNFMIPKVWWSRFFLIDLINKFFQKPILFKHCPDEIPFSTLYWIGQFIVQFFRINANQFNLPISQSNSIQEILQLEPFAWTDLIFNTEIIWPTTNILSGRAPP